MQDLTQPAKGGDLSVNPFRDDVFSPQSPIPGTPQIHQEEMDHCVKAIEKMVTVAASGGVNQAHGELISISSPLAGYGKSHLISRISKSMLSSVSTIELSFGQKASWHELLSLTLHNLDAGDSRARIDSSLLDEAGAGFLANLIGTAVARGIIEERECPTALTTLQNDSCTAFSEGFRSKLLVWLKKKSQMIRSSVKLSSVEFPGFSREDVSFWTDYFINHFRRDVGGFNALGDLTELESRERVLQLLKIASNCHPLLIIADHLDYSHGSQSAGMEIATSLTSIVENVSNCVLIISINDDLWDSVFKGKLPSALLDRLSGENLELSPVNFDEAKELVVNRLCASGINYHQSHKFATAVSEDSDWAETTELFPRKILRQAKEIWKTRGHEFCQPAQPGDVKAPFESAEKVSGETDIDRPVAPLLYTEPKTAQEQAPLNLPNPFISPTAMVYSDRPSPVAPVGQPGETVSGRNAFSDPAPADVASVEFLSPNHDRRVESAHSPVVDCPMEDTAALHKDEPGPHTAANVGAVNGQTNGHAASGHIQNGVKIPAQAEGTRPMEAYFDQLLGHFEKKADQLEIDFPAMELFIKTVGEKHSPLSQSEMTIPGGQSTSLRWNLKNYIVWIGFEPARNTYYYNNLLQKLLSDPATTPGKIVCFTHESSPYSHDLLTSNGIDADHLKHYFDFIQLSNKELVLIHSASKFLKETTEKGYQKEALKFILKKLNPLWQRLCQPLGSTK